MNVIEKEYRKINYFLSGPKLVFGNGARYKLSEEVYSLLGDKKTAKVLVITDEGVLKVGIVDTIKGMFEDNNIEMNVFHKISSEPTIETMEEAIRYANQLSYDIVIGMGGGSAMDTAKVVSLAKYNSGDVNTYLEESEYNGRTPLILIPTTAGTGSEVTGDAVFSVNGIKRWLSNPILIADTAIIDPMLTVSMPAKITASSGLDVLCHAIEGIMTAYTNSIVEMYATKAVELTMNNLEKAFCCGKDIEARYNMSIAAMLAGIANLNAPATYPHSIGYTLTNRYKIPHGLSCAVGLPYVMEYNFTACKDKFAKLTESAYPDFRGSKEEKALFIIKKIRDITKSVNAYTTLYEIGVEESVLDILAEECFTKFPRVYNICDMSVDQIKKLYKTMYK